VGIATERLQTVGGAAVTKGRGLGAAVELNSSYGYAPRKVYFIFKRIFDVAASLGAMIVLFPLSPVIALLIVLDSKGPVFFTQLRLGKNGALFDIYKFSTMAHNAAEIRNPDGSKFVGENDPRLTRDTPGAPGLDDEIFRRKRLLRPGLTNLATIHGRVNRDLRYVVPVGFRDYFKNNCPDFPARRHLYLAPIFLGSGA
jgi:Bacterial sugar transferase